MENDILFLIIFMLSLGYVEQFVSKIYDAMDKPSLLWTIIALFSFMIIFLSNFIAGLCLVLLVFIFDKKVIKLISKRL